MSKHDEHMRWAYLDGELSASEANDLDKELTDDERQRLAAEMRLESAVADKLREDAECPSDVWRRLQGEVWKTEMNEHRRRNRLSRWAVPALAAAAGIIIAFALFFPTGPDDIPPFLSLAAASVSELAETSEIRGTDDEIEDYLRQAGLAIDLKGNGQVVSHHQIELLGARLADYNGKPVARIQYMCCGQPIELVVARRDDPAGKAIVRAQENKSHQGPALGQGDFIFAALGDPHHTDEVLNLMQAAP